MENTIHTINELLTYLKKYQEESMESRNGNDFIFRGMSDKSWKLLPGLFREYKEPQKSTVISNPYSKRIYTAREIDILAHFKKEAIGFLPQISLNDDFMWLQYAQHFGVPTRLLDFTTNPLIALYFCCKSESKEDGIIWFINVNPFITWSYDDSFCKKLLSFSRNTLISSIMKSLKESSGNSEKSRPVFISPPLIDQRMSAQSSRFLLWGKDANSLEDMIDDANKMTLSPNGVMTEHANDQRFLACIIIPGKSKHNLMQELDLFGINEKSVFPGPDGIGRYIEKHYRDI